MTTDAAAAPPQAQQVNANPGAGITTQSKCCFCFATNTGFNILRWLCLIGGIASLLGILGIFSFEGDAAIYSIIVVVMALGNAAFLIWCFMTIGKALDAANDSKDNRLLLVKVCNVGMIWETIYIILGMLAAYFVWDSVQQVANQLAQAFGGMNIQIEQPDYWGGAIIGAVIQIVFNILIWMWWRSSAQAFANEK